MLRWRFLIVVLVISSVVQGCSNPFARFYFDNTGGYDITQSPVVVLPEGEPEIYRGVDLEQDNLTMLENNYLLVGYSAFNAGNVSERGAIEHAKKVHAGVVILYSSYTSSVSGSIPLILPDKTTSTTSIYGSVNATAYTTTYGTQTLYIPYTVHRSDYIATYWVKGKSPVLGVHFRGLTPEIKQQIGSNKGVLVIAVIKGSPAFDADILRGDVIVRIGEYQVYDEASCYEALSKLQGKETDIVIIRGYVEISKTVHLKSRN